MRLDCLPSGCTAEFISPGALIWRIQDEGGAEPDPRRIFLVGIVINGKFWLKVLFIHQGGIGQFAHLARALAGDPKNQVVLITKDDAPDTGGIASARYTVPNRPSANLHRYLNQMESQVLHGQGAAHAALKLKDVGFLPDVICVHTGWGEALFLRDVFPEAKILAYCEKYYSPVGEGAGFSPHYKESFEQDCLIRMRNAHMLVSLAAADWGISPTQWQWSGHPAFLRDRISVIHDGIDTDLLQPDPAAVLKLPNGRSLTGDDETVTFVARNLEPHRGFDVFMRGIEKVLARRQNAQVVLVGGDDRGYGPLPARGGTWRNLLLTQVKIDPDRVHFLGQIAHDQYRKVLSISKTHVYLTYPSVLSWSMLEAMASGCFVIGSRTPPVMEVIQDGENGRLVDFFDSDAVADRVVEALNDPSATMSMRQAARQTVLERYDLKRVCLPAQIDLLSTLAGNRYPRATENSNASGRYDDPRQ